MNKSLGTHDNPIDLDADFNDAFFPQERSDMAISSSPLTQSSSTMEPTTGSADADLGQSAFTQWEQFMQWEVPRDNGPGGLLDDFELEAWLKDAIGP